MKTERQKAIEAIASIIEKNPDCQFHIDNDCWWITDSTGESSLCSSNEFSFNTEWYSYSNTYGSGLSEVLVELLNRRGFKIKASAV